MRDVLVILSVDQRVAACGGLLAGAGGCLWCVWPNTNRDKWVSGDRRSNVLATGFKLFTQEESEKK